MVNHVGPGKFPAAEMALSVGQLKGNIVKAVT